MTNALYFDDYLSTPIGKLHIQASLNGIRKVIFVKTITEKTRENNWTLACKQQLSEYFFGERKAFNLPLDQKGTVFQKEVWTALLDIPFGDATSYGEIALSIHNPKAVRAVGAANGKNPISIIVPCHRVIVK